MYLLTTEHGGQFKSIKSPKKVTLIEINYNVIGSNHEVIDEDGLVIFCHEINLHNVNHCDKVYGKYYKDLLSMPNSLPRKTRKAMTKFFNRCPEYSI